MSDIGNIDEYIHYVDFHGGSTEECDFIFQVAEIVNDFLRFVHSKYSYMGGAIELLIRASQKTNASARIDNKIIINRGLIDFFILHEEQSGNGKYSAFLSLDQQDKVQRLGGLLWVVAHEFFHFARGHHKVRATSKLMAQALEFDADCYAVAGTYRYFMYRMQNEHSRIDIKNIVCRSFYFGIRQLIELDDIEIAKEGSHPRWHVRLKAAHDKLVDLDMPLVNYGITKKFCDECDILIHSLVDFEREFLMKNGVENIGDSKFLLSMFRDEMPPPEYSKIMDEWERIEPLVLNGSNLFGDKFIHGGPFTSFGDGGIVNFRQGIRYTAKSVNWRLRPKFHMHSSSLDVEVYAATMIIPNAYWVIY